MGNIYALCIGGQGQGIDCVDVMGSALCVVGKYLCPAASPWSAENPVAPPWMCIQRGLRSQAIPCEMTFLTA